MTALTISNVAVTEGGVTEGSQQEQQDNLDKTKGYGWEITDVISHQPGAVQGLEDVM